MAKTDRGYKLLFSHPRMVRDLLCGFTQGSWASRLDFATLERVPGSSVGEDFRERHNDILWRLRWSGRGRLEWLYLVIEFQAAPQPFMALRVAAYVCLLIQMLIRAGSLKGSQGLPAVLSVVLYSGRRPWRSPQDLLSLFSPVPRALRRHLPRLEYILVGGDQPGREVDGNLVSILLKTEACKTPEELSSLAGKVARLLPRGQELELRRAFTVWILDVMRRTFPGATISGVEDLEEITMLEENLRDWYNRGMRKSRREGRKEGLQEGVVQGIHRTVLRLMEQRFGAVPKKARDRVQALTSVEELESLVDRVVSAGSLRDLGLT